MSATDTTPRDYKSTLFLPDTPFPMKAGLPKAEPEWLARWEAMGLYGLLRAQGIGRPRFVFHDGPPYANGHIHLGTGMNKILKDFVVRSQTMLGKDVPFIHGWDCHGLPIEWKVEEQYRQQGRDKDQVPLTEFRQECRAFAQHWLGVQRAEFKRLGCLGDWDNPYTTMAPESEAQIVRELQKFAANGLIYRGSKPVMWSVVEKTALAEAEIEYHEKLSPTVFVKFPVKAGAHRGAKAVIWTTTPWTLPGNRAICYSPKIAYGVYRVTDKGESTGAENGELLMFADALAESARAAAKIVAWERVGDADPQGLVCAHPFAGQGYDFDVPLLPGDHVTEDAGTGFVHTAPGHGEEDFEVGRAHGLEIPFTVAEDGAFYPDVPLFAGKKVLTAEGKDGDANGAVIGELVKAGALLAKGKLRHDYPHSWRSKAPVIFRNTPQWFMAMDRPIASLGGRTLRQLALAALEEVTFVPPQGRNRLRAMVETRPDWVISRQRAWGVPIPIFVRKDDGTLLRDDAVDARVAAAVAEGGTDVWFTTDPQVFLGGTHRAADYERVDDIVDVWFESGSTHSFVIEGKAGWPADLYLEGSDQHRGWFQSSLLEACGTRGRAPFKTVVTHGFVLDEKGYKQSKSLGNTVEPQTVADQHGIEILRLWAASSDFTEDLRLGGEILKANVESYRKLRNTMRYMLANLKDWSETERVDDPAQMPELERYVLHRLTELDATVRAGYAGFDFNRVFTALFAFCTSDLSAFYFDIRKDALYCDGPRSLRRRSARTVLDALFSCLTAWLAPVMCFTMEEVWQARHPGSASVHLRTFPELPASWRDAALAARWERIRALRRVVTGVLETARRDKRIGSSLEAAPTLYVTDAADAQLFAAASLAEIAITSAARVSTAAPPADAFRLDDVKGAAAAFAPAEGEKCARCWMVLPDVGAQPAHPSLCGRCAEAVEAR